jgi:hypothetical protein
MIVRNRPSQYMKRSDLVGSTTQIKRGELTIGRKRNVREFATAEIDANFYFIFREKRALKKR